MPPLRCALRSLSPCISSLRTASQFAALSWVFKTKALSSVNYPSSISLGLTSQVQVLKVMVPNVGSKPFAPQGEVQGFDLPPNCGFQTTGRVDDVIVPVSPTCSTLSFFIHHCIGGVGWLVLGGVIAPEETIP